MAKKYYWLRLKDDWFNSKVIKKLRKIAGGDTYTIIYLKMQLLSLKNEGKLYYEGVEDSFEEELALDLDEDKATVQRDAGVVHIQPDKMQDQERNYQVCKFMAIKRAGQRQSPVQRARTISYATVG